MGLIWLISLVSCFILFWLFGDIILFLTFIAVIGTFILLKAVKRYPFVYLELLCLSAYVLLVLACVLFPALRTLKILVIILGVWFEILVFFRRRC